MIATAGVVEFETVRRDTREKSGTPSAYKLAPAPDGSASATLHRNESFSRARRFLGGRACECGPEGVEDMSLGLLYDLWRKLFKGGLGDECAELSRDRLVHHSLLKDSSVDPRHASRASDCCRFDHR